MNEKEVAFIICVNDETELEECQYYINRLHVPEGYTVTLLCVWEAASMTSGYQEAMESSNAKYKVYLHQDVFIIHRDFIRDMLSVFEQNPDVGMIGCIGTQNAPDKLVPVQSWNEGKVFHNLCPALLDYQGEKEGDVAVQMLDGLLIATQYDVPWRKDIFQGWDFYDISQCMEMQKREKKILVPYQKTPWCFHDNHVSRMQNYYRDYEIFLKEYYGITENISSTTKEDMELEQLEEQLKVLLNNFLVMKQRDLFCEVFQTAESRQYIALREYRLIADIERVESENGVKEKFWSEDATKDEIFEKLRRLKFLMKRLEYDAEEEGDYEYLEQHFSNVAISAINFEYVWDQEKVADKIRKYRQENVER